MLSSVFGCHQQNLLIVSCHMPDAVEKNTALNDLIMANGCILKGGNSVKINLPSKRSIFFLFYLIYLFILYLFIYLFISFWGSDLF